ncbi:hypothetical protein [Spirosoma utsteinense]|uniref:Outer membrane protein beta-barrel domain-containing protein n=1 Tax=Spirosoma utsteinense TaxID=2585773 RepID=A0ABR6WEJ6_9BACT|nr:hypothetical protein [Spirosoma utsteinense]MBC3787989.1 hypothetical protein [Spirosoma utsteinense]MBC3794934.1 hypothetical protein [Spirosoma utsteinense]
MRTYRFLLTLVLAGYLSSTLAQSPRLSGGAGFFRLGYARLHQVGQTLDQFTPPQLSGIGNDFVYVGGEGYARLDRFILGGGGYGMARRSLSGPGYHAEPFGGGGHLFLGRILVNSRRLWLYPTVGAGVAVVGITQSQQQGQTTRESSVLLPSLNVQFGVGADWLVAAFTEDDSYGGLLLGMRAGYQLSPSSSGWRSTGELVPPDRPRYATNGYFVTLTIGAGGFRRLPPRPTSH